VYVVFLRGWGIEEGTMGLPDIFAEDYAEKADSAALVQCAPRRDDPWLPGYYIGQEPAWAHNELLLAEALLTGPPSPIQNELKKFLSAGDSPQRRKSFIFNTYSGFLDIINGAIRKHDPNHLILGVGFAGKTPPEVIRASQRCFDVFSFTNFNYLADLEEIQTIHDLIGVPVIIGEFHFGTTGHGLAAGLVQTASLEERGNAYRYYVENSARQ
jgi:hypothetical protein